MCGRAYETFTEDELEMRYLNTQKVKIPKFIPNYNICPTHLAPIVFETSIGRQINLFRWGLVPLWAKDVKSADKYSMINAKAEEIAQKKSYAKPFQRQRCIVPLSGFYEWLRPEQGAKKPYAIYLKDKSIMSVAGVWEHWQGQNDEEVLSFSVITTEANSFMANIHNRMPVILEKKDEQLWLDPSFHDVEKLQKLLKPCDSELLAAHEVSTQVNSPRNNGAELLNPVG